MTESASATGPAVVRARIVENRYLDSIALLEISAALSSVDGVDLATAVMATAENLARANDAGLGVDGHAASPSDLYVAVRGSDAACADALDRVDALLARPATSVSVSVDREPARSLVQRARSAGVDALALISVPGAFAAAEAEKALRLGMHAMVFSDNVALDDEVRLKQLAGESGLLVMGPDCGTAIINGVPLGFANVVRRGRVGVIGASGTGMQEVTSRLHRLHVGVSQAIGCGGRDLSSAVGGSTMCAAIDLLNNDPGTDVLVLVSKPPAPDVLRRVLDVAGRCTKPVVACFLGLSAAQLDALDVLGALPAVPSNVTLVDSLVGAADRAAGVEYRLAAAPGGFSRGPGTVVRGGFVGGTFCHEAELTLLAAGVSESDLELVDFGDDEYTVGRPHPMIDPSLRDGFVADALADPSTAVVLVDVVLGHGSHRRPVDGLLEVLRAQRDVAEVAVPVVAHVCGTELDEQGRDAIVRSLRDAGVFVAESNWEAASWVGTLLGSEPSTYGFGEPPVEVHAGRQSEGTSPFADPLRVVNVGLASFADTAASSGTPVAHLDWRPPVDADPATARLVASVSSHPAIDAANAVSLDRFLAANPTLLDVASAATVVPAMGERRLLLHAGPPIEWARMCGPMRGALIGAVLFEGWADDPSGAESLLEQGRIDIEPCHHHGAVGPMAGVVSPSMPMWVVEDPGTGGRSLASLNEGLGKVLRFGAYGAEVVERLQRMASQIGPTLRDALRLTGPIPLKPLMAQALTMGDEVHNRNGAATGQLLKRLAGPIVRAGDPGVAADVLEAIGSNDHFFLNVSMAACKLMLDAASGVAGSTMVTAMARNGVEFGIRMSGTGDRWFCAPAKQIDGLYFPGFGPADANPDLGDSAITETAGVGAFAMAAAPAIVGFVGGTPDDALAHTRRMREIAIGTNPAFTIPSLGFSATSAGIDARLVVDTGILPVINTGIAHREAGVGQIGAGITSAPWECFRDALRALETPPR